MAEECKSEPMEQDDKKSEVKQEVKEEEERPSTPGTQSSPASGQTKRKSRLNIVSYTESLSSIFLWFETWDD